MAFFDRFRKKKSVSSEAENLFHNEHGFNPDAHHVVLNYLRRLWKGEAPDPVFEKKRLSRDLNFNTLNLAEVIFAVSEERKIPLDTIVDFLACGIPGGGDADLSILVQRVSMLAGSFSERERDVLLDSGVVGDRKEIAYLTPQFDYVEFVVKYCRAFESLKGDNTFGNRKGGYVEIEEDPGWR